MRLDGYIRVSQVAGRTGPAYISPSVQREQIAAYATAKGFEIAEWFSDEDVSGAAARRPGLDAILERIEAGESQGLIVAKLDRFARSIRVALDTIERIEKAGGVLISVADNLDTTTAMGRFAQTMMLAIAELERERLKETWHIARSRAVARGVHGGPNAPPGYVKGEDGRLQPTAQAPIVRHAFEMKADGHGTTVIGRMLDERGVQPTSGADHWTASTVAKLLRNRAYIGEARMGDLVNPAAHEAIVSRSLFEATQTTKGQHASSTGNYLLTGLIRCAGCRHLASGQIRSGSGEHTYRCKKQFSAGACPRPASILAHVADQAVEKVFLARIERWTFNAVTAEAKADALLDDLEAAEAELAAWRDDLEAVRAIGRASHLDGLRARQARVDELRAKLATSPRRNLPAGLTALDVWAMASAQEKQRLLASEIRAVFLRSVGKGNRVPVADRLDIITIEDTRDLALPKPGGHNPILPWNPASTGIAGGE